MAITYRIGVRPAIKVPLGVGGNRAELTLVAAGGDDELVVKE